MALVYVLLGCFHFFLLDPYYEPLRGWCQCSLAWPDPFIQGCYQ